jgi:hypothetical protein
MMEAEPRMPDITAEITLLPAGRNVRKGPLVGRSLGCSVVIDGALYDARFDLEPGKAIALGTTVVLEATFDDPDAVLKLLTVGKPLTLWENGAVGHGKVLKIHGGE